MVNILAGKKQNPDCITVDIGRMHCRPANGPADPSPLVLDILSNLKSLELPCYFEKQNFSDLSQQLERLRHLLTYLISEETFPTDPKTLEFMALYDGLTHLPNRVHFETRLKKHLDSATATSVPFYVVFLDLDEFKIVNDTYGHEIGDWLLGKVAQRLRNSLRDHDFVARYGGDEFTAIIQADQNLVIELILQRLVASLSLPFHKDDLVLQIGVSIGVAHYPHTSCDFANLIKNADAAMYLAKSAGKNGFRICG